MKSHLHDGYLGRRSWFLGRGPVLIFLEGCSLRFSQSLFDHDSEMVDDFVSLAIRVLGLFGSQSLYTK